MPAPTAFATLAALHEQMAAAYRELAEAPVPQPDRAVGLAEAAARLGCSRAWLSRRPNWERIGGFKDADRRIKVPLSALEAWIRARGRA